ncbi:MAG: hypothetical protein RLZ98_1026 [Pseudomonadota bacterium]|jgi:hypothetical protein
MLVEPSNAPPAVYLLADHLDAVLAAGEDVRRLTIDVPPALQGLDTAFASELRSFVDAIHRHELALLLHVIEARKRVGDMPRTDKMLRMMLALFTGGTAALADAAFECGDPARHEFATSGDPLDYLRSRGLIALDKGSLVGQLAIEVNDQMLVAGRVPLGDVLNHTAAVLDALELYFDLYSSTETNARGTPAASKLLTPPLT